MAELILCKQVEYFFHSLPKQMLTLDKIFATVSSTAFVHTCCYNQHKMKVSLRGYIRLIKHDQQWQLQLRLSFLCVKVTEILFSS